MAAAIWSAPSRTLLDYPAAAFIRFCENHGLLKLAGRPVWRTVVGGSRSYIDKLTAAYADRIKLGSGATAVVRTGTGASVRDAGGAVDTFDHIVFACHADQALRLLDDPLPAEQRALSAFRYSRNHAVLHGDPGLMPRNRRVWASWNYLGDRTAAEDARHLCITYWMNRLQGIAPETPLFVTLNPVREPRAETVLREELYEHPIFDAAALKGQQALWDLQGRRNTWYCGAHFGSGFHEDGLQSGLAVAEMLGGVRRPWRVANESGRIPRRSAEAAVAAPGLAA
jgi:predicted NAD/FAD-binding protein